MRCIGADADPQGQVPPKTAQQQSSRLLSNVVVLEAVAELVQERSGRAKVTGEWRAGVPLGTGGYPLGEPVGVLRPVQTHRSEVRLVKAGVPSPSLLGTREVAWRPPPSARLERDTTVQGCGG